MIQLSFNFEYKVTHHDLYEDLFRLQRYNWMWQIVPCDIVFHPTGIHTVREV